ncbi:ABC transporter ATP-binding protein [Micromonospora sp. NBC_01796]|uniref:ABC transporter ATP-binding protein n=1 Tax=Micromonospora sp. NBC_01796 TaxID=2975987 RepID=UPI002DD7CF13|nr:ABC transporter ATP-binding protein [Micromonospora sp. NBC_01796]WSA86897.1 ABC transporter ATP-binding protein [Micromonospora sp. NBC_01796]
MSAVVTARAVTKRFGQTTALDDVSFSLTENTIHGLLGRNGAGKTTLMQILTGQNFATSGELSVFGQHPYENDEVLSGVCFIKESQTYPQNFQVRHALTAARLLFPRWDQEFATALVDDFQLPLRRQVRKLSRGMLSALGVIIGLAARAPLTFFDEPYLGLDATARQIFYDRLLADYAEHPRTIVLSTHLIDEVSNLIEHVLLIDRGRILLDESAEALRTELVTVSGPVDEVEQMAANAEELHRERLGNLVRVTLRGRFDPAERNRITGLGLELTPVPLQELVVRLTSTSNGAGNVRTAGKGALR